MQRLWHASYLRPLPSPDASSPLPHRPTRRPPSSPAPSSPSPPPLPTPFRPCPTLLPPVPIQPRTHPRISLPVYLFFLDSRASPSPLFRHLPHTNMATGPPGSMSLPLSDTQPSSDPSWEGDRMSVLLYLSISFPTSFFHPIPGSTSTYTITAINVAFAKPLASFSQKLRYHQTRPPQSTLSKAFCSSPSLPSCLRFAPSELVPLPQVVECLLGAFHR